MKMFALLSDQGTAAAETALCEECFAGDENRAYAQEMGSQAGDIADLQTFHDCSPNEALYCCICGRDADGNLSPEEEEYEDQRAAFRRKEVVYVSVWDDTIACRSACWFDLATLRVSDIVPASNQVDAESCNALTDEYVEFDGKQLRERDGVVFEYKGL